MPFGPFLAAAGWLVMLWGPQMVAGYLGLFRPYSE
jgi:leader peptidase (prepilin peptidase)/N-methyltransferase